MRIAKSKKVSFALPIVLKLNDLQANKIKIVSGNNSICSHLWMWRMDNVECDSKKIQNIWKQNVENDMQTNSWYKNKLMEKRNVIMNYTTTGRIRFGTSYQQHKVAKNIVVGKCHEKKRKRYQPRSFGMEAGQDETSGQTKEKLTRCNTI